MAEIFGSSLIYSKKKKKLTNLKTVRQFAAQNAITNTKGYQALEKFWPLDVISYFNSFYFYFLKSK